MYRIYHGLCREEEERLEADRRIPRSVSNSNTHERSRVFVMNMEAEVKVKPYPVPKHPKTHMERTESIKGETKEISKLTREQVNRLADSQRQLIIGTFAKMEANPVKIGLNILVK
ncbi:unnamed protein product [Strongylus vulgaris]|uniref:Uncharacterized protein n=1 Tax=Strongylus vulgaris TaxID=40348 RepID=A0A3P7IKF8_STRVU|nr:unnamed protein product [Strongylus vulgaris]